MTRARVRTVTSLSVLMVLGIFLAAPKARPHPQIKQEQTPTGQPWDGGTRYPDWQAPSTLTIVNDCHRAHAFSITPQDANFIDFKGVKQVTVPGQRSFELPVRFHTDGMAPGDYKGLVTVLCLDCKEVPPCTQDRKLLTPHITIIPRPVGTTQSTTPVTPSAPDCRIDYIGCDELQRQMNAKKAEYEQALMAYFNAAAAAERLDWIADDDCEYAEDGSDYLWSMRLAAAMSGQPVASLVSLTNEVDDAWSRCYESHEAWYAADAKARGLGAVADASYQAYVDAAAAYQQCLTDQFKVCKLTPKYDFTFGGSDYWKPWPVRPTSGSTGGKENKPDWPKVGSNPPGGVSTGTGGHPTTQSKSPCSVMTDDCEHLRLIWQQKEAEATAAQANADAAKADADKLARAASDAAKVAADAAAAVPKINEGTGWMESNGIRLTSHDLALASAASKQAFADYQSGKISAYELQKIWGESGDAAAIAKLRKAEEDAIAAAKAKADQAARAAAAAKAQADGAKTNAAKAQQTADQAKAAANAAKQAFEDCIKKLKECERKDTGGGGGTTAGENPGGTKPGGTTPPVGGGNPHTTSNDCPPFPENCDALKARYEALKTQAAIAQAQADRAKADQNWNNQQANTLDKEAKSAQDFADGQTQRAKIWREMAGNMAAIAARDLQLRDQYPAGSPTWNSWNKAAESDRKDIDVRNGYADELEVTEQKYDMRAAKLKAEAAQLRGSSNDAQAAADKAKAEADAAYKAWQDCLARKKQYEDDCKKKGATPGTTGRGQTGGTTTTGGTRGGGGQTGNPPTTGSGTVARGGNPPGGTGPVTGPGTSTTNDKKKGKRCEWRFLEVDLGPYTMDSKTKSDQLAKIREQLQKFLEKAAPNAAKGLDAALKGFTLTSVAQNVYITYILVEIDLDTGSETVIDSKTITLEDKDAIDFWGKADSSEARAGRSSTIARNTPRGGCPPGR